MDIKAVQQMIVDLRDKLPFRNTILICSTDGDLIVQTDHNGEVDLKRVAVQTATALGVSIRIGDALHLGQNKELHFVGRDGHLFVFRLDNSYGLAVVSPNECNVALLNIMTHRVIESINEQRMLSWNE